MIQRNVTRSPMRERILDAADRLLSRYGYQKTTADDLAREAAIGRRTVYVHFTSKEEIFLASIDRVVERLIDELKRVLYSGGSADERLRRMLMTRILFRFDSVHDYHQSLDDMFSVLRSAYLERRDRYMAMEAEVFTQVLVEGQQRARLVQERGVPLISGRGAQPWDMQPELAQQLEHQVSEAKRNIWTTLSPEFLNQFPTALHLHTQSQDRQDYICHPPSGESLSAESEDLLASYPAQQYDVRIVISDGLNAKSISDPGHLQPFLLALRQQLQEGGHQVDPREIFLENGRVRAGYRIGEQSFAADPPGADSSENKAPKTIVHVIGERPGTIHDNYSVYVSTAPSSVWQQPGKMDHDQTKVVSGISDSSLDPQVAAQQVYQLIGPYSDSKPGDGPP